MNLTLVSEILQDLRHALRLLRRAPGLAGALLIVLGTAFGAAIALFAIADALVLRALPFAEPERLVTVWQTNPKDDNEKDDVSPANFLDWRDGVSGFAGLAAAIPYSYDWLDGVEPESWPAVQVTEGFFEVVGARPLLGRTFSRDEHAPGRADVMVLTHGLWRQRFAADPKVVGKTVRLNAGVFTVIGVLAEDFDLGLLPRGNVRSLYTPHVVADYERRTRGSAWWNVVGRLGPGSSVAAAQAELDQVSKRLARENPRTNEGVRAPLLPLREHLIGAVRPALLTLGCGGAMLLAIAWANVSGLLVARAQARELEFAVRASLGAGRGRLMRQTLTETLVFAVGGVLIGVGLASAAVRALVRLCPVPVPRLALAGIDARALSFAALLAIVSAFVCALLPMLRVGRAQLVARAREGRAEGGRQAARRSLVVSQLALALVLLSACGLLLRSVAGLLSIDPGFEKDRLLALQVFAWARNRTPASRAAFFEEAQARVAAVARVAGVGAVSLMPFSENAIDIRIPLAVAGKPVEPGSEPRVHLSVASAGYFDAMRIRLLRGRGFLPSDVLGGPPVAVVNEVLSRRVFGGEDPIGQRLTVPLDGQPVLAEIVGVVAAARQARLERAAGPEVYLPHSQFPFGSMTLVVRTRAESASALKDVQRAIWSLDPQQTFARVGVVSEMVARTISDRLFLMSVSGAFAGVALLLAAVGAYGLLSYLVSARTREFGVRMALGAGASRILGLVLREGCALLAIGLGLGLAGALAAGWALRAFLWGVSPFDPMTLVSVVLAVTAVSLLAFGGPALRASRVDPARALRAD